MLRLAGKVRWLTNVTQLSSTRNYSRKKAVKYQANRAKRNDEPPRSNLMFTMQTNWNTGAAASNTQHHQKKTVVDKAWSKSSASNRHKQQEAAFRSNQDFTMQTNWNTGAASNTQHRHKKTIADISRSKSAASNRHKQQEAAFRSNHDFTMKTSWNTGSASNAPHHNKNTVADKAWSKSSASNRHQRQNSAHKSNHNYTTHSNWASNAASSNDQRDWQGKDNHWKVKQQGVWKERREGRPEEWRTNAAQKQSDHRKSEKPRPLERYEKRDRRYQLLGDEGEAERPDLGKLLVHQASTSDPYEDSDPLTAVELQRAKKQKRALFRTMVNKYYRPPGEPDLLTWEAKLQVHQLHSEAPDEWPVERLAESFPASVRVIRKILKQSSIRNIEWIIEHDRRIMQNWERLADAGRSGTGAMLPMYERLSQEGKLTTLAHVAGHVMLPSPRDPTHDMRDPALQTPGRFASLVADYVKEQKERAVRDSGLSDDERRQMYKLSKETTLKALSSMLNAMPAPAQSAPQAPPRAQARLASGKQGVDYTQAFAPRDESVMRPRDTSNAHVTTSQRPQRSLLDAIIEEQNTRDQETGTFDQKSGAPDPESGSNDLNLGSRDKSESRNDSEGHEEDEEDAAFAEWQRGQELNLEAVLREDPSPDAMTSHTDALPHPALEEVVSKPGSAASPPLTSAEWVLDSPGMAGTEKLAPPPDDNTDSDTAAHAQDHVTEPSTRRPLKRGGPRGSVRRRKGDHYDEHGDFLYREP